MRKIIAAEIANHSNASEVSHADYINIKASVKDQVTSQSASEGFIWEDKDLSRVLSPLSNIGYISKKHAQWKYGFKLNGFDGIWEKAYCTPKVTTENSKIFWDMLQKFASNVNYRYRIHPSKKGKGQHSSGYVLAMLSVGFIQEERDEVPGKLYSLTHAAKTAHKPRLIQPGIRIDSAYEPPSPHPRRIMNPAHLPRSLHPVSTIIPVHQPQPWGMMNLPRSLHPVSTIIPVHQPQPWGMMNMVHQPHPGSIVNPQPQPWGMMNLVHQLQQQQEEALARRNERAREALARLNEKARQEQARLIAEREGERERAREALARLNEKARQEQARLAAEREGEREQARAEERERTRKLREERQKREAVPGGILNSAHVTVRPHTPAPPDSVGDNRNEEERTTEEEDAMLLLSLRKGLNMLDGAESPRASSNGPNLTYGL
jgi:hypothetical protein